MPVIGYAATAFGLYVAGKVVGSITEKKPSYKQPKTAFQVNTRSSREPLSVIYGQCRVGVNKTYIHVENPWLYMVAELGEGEINGIVREDSTVYSTVNTELPGFSTAPDNPPLVYLDDNLYTEYGTNAYLEFFNGAGNQAASTVLTTETPFDQTLPYTAYLYLSLKYDPDKFNAEPDITAVVQGIKIYNPITMVTEYSNNPALCAYDYLTRSSQRGGMGIAASRIDLVSLSTAINYCDTKGWTCNMPIGDNQAVADNLELIFNNFRGEIIQSADMLKIRFRDLNYESVTLSLSEDDIIRSDDRHSSIEINQPDIGVRPNAIRATHLSAEKKGKADDIIVTDADAIATDGDYREVTVSVLGLSEPALVQKMCNYYLERLRLNKTVSFIGTSRCMALEPLDLIYLDHTFAGWSGKLLRILSCPISGDHTVSITAIEEHSIFYDDVYNLTAHHWDDTDLPGPLDLPPSVRNVSQAEEVYFYRNRSYTRWNIDFDAPAASVYPWWDYAEIWLKIGTGEWRYMTRCDTNYSVDPVEDGETYTLKIRSVSIFGLKEPFDNCTTVSDTITGPTGGPGDLTGIIAIANGDSVTIYGTPLTDPDIEGYEIRLGSTWGAGIFISFNKNISLRLNGVRPGTHTFWAAAKDNAGRYSANPVSATVQVFLPPGYTLLPTYGSWAWDFTTGSHSNTEHDTYDGEDALKCSHTSAVLIGTWTSPTYDLNAVEKVRIWGDFRVDFESSATTWDGVFPLTTTGADLITDGAFSNWTADDLDDWTESNCDAAEDVAGQTGSAAKITVTTATYGIYQDIVVTEETEYILRGYYKNTAGDKAQVWIYDNTNSKFISAPDNLDLEDSVGSFSAFSYVFTTPTDCISLRLWLCAANAGDIVWFDTVSLYAIDTAASITWDDVDPDADKTWQDIFQQTSASQILATLRYHDDPIDPWEEVTYFQLLCAEIEARYVSVVVTIIDPSYDANLYLRELNMLAYEGPQ